MDPIRQAIDRAKGRDVKTPTQSGGASPRPPLPVGRPAPAFTTNAGELLHGREVELSSSHLEAHRIVAHNVADPRARSFDMLRTQVLHSMDERGSRCIAVTSPTAGSGKTVTALNLAFSLARQEDRSVLLLDLDLQRPQVANALGIKCEQGLLSVLEGQVALRDAVLETHIGDYHCSVLPTEKPSMHSSELIGSRAMRGLLQEIRAGSPTQIVVLDLPPVLAGDDVISIVPHLDCVLLVAAVGFSTVQEIKECSRLLQSTEIVRLVLNKSTEQTTDQYY